jgi:ClpX C4-type zinc finger
MSDVASRPPPIMDSAKLVAYASTDGDVEFTDRITLLVGDEGRLGRVPCLAICLNYCIPGDVLLFFCDADWTTKGVIAFTTVDEAKLKAERGYKGITNKWIDSPYSDEDLATFLRDVYEVDPKAEWWKTICSFCGKDVDDGRVVSGARANICEKCVDKYHALLQDDADA